MRFNDILYVVTIFEENSFSRAADKLFLSQSALSQAVHKLEEDLGVLLFIRKNNKIKPTLACYTFVEGGRAIINAKFMLQEKMNAIVESRKNSLRIGVPSFYNKYLMLQILPTFKKAFPGVTVNVTEDSSYNLEELVLKGILDFCLVAIPLQHKTLEYEVVYTDEIMFALPKSHPLNKSQHLDALGEYPLIDLHQVKDEPFIVLNNLRFTPMGLRLCEESGFIPNIAYKPKVWDNVRTFIEQGLGVGFIHGLIPGNDRTNKYVQYYHIQSDHVYRPFVAAYESNDTLSEAASNFIRIVKEYSHLHSRLK